MQEGVCVEAKSKPKEDCWMVWNMIKWAKSGN